MNQNFMTLLPLILLIFIMYFLLIRPQKKREKAVNAMRNAIKVGDEVITIGGICGKIVKTKDETLTIHVGADKTKFEVMRWAISKVANEEPASSPSKKVMKEEVEDDQNQEAPKKALPKKMKKTAPAQEAPLDDYNTEEKPVEVTAEVVEEAEITKEK